MKGFLLGFLRALKLPVKLLAGWLKKRRKKSEREEKQRKYVRNFSPGRLKNTTWQRNTQAFNRKGDLEKGMGKDKKLKKKRKFTKKIN